MGIGFCRSRRQAHWDSKEYMDKSITKKSAAVFLILLIGILFLFAVYPLRLFTTTATLTGEGTILAASDPVDADNDAGDYFTAQYSHLDTLETWVEEVDQDGTVTLRLFHVKSDGSLENLAEEEQALPGEKGFVSFPIDVDTVPGDTYIYILYANEDAVFRSGYESVSIPDREDAIWYQSGFYHDTGVDGYAVATRLHYRIPLPKRTSLLLMCGIALATLAALFLTIWYYKKPGRNRETTVFHALGTVVTPPATVLTVLGMIAVFPLRIYDDRPLDCIAYEIGLALSWVLLMYGFWHKRSDQERGKNISLSHLLIILFLAMALAASCDYMNAVNDLIHACAEYRMLLFLFLVILLMGRLSGIARILVPVSGGCGAVYAIWYGLSHAANSTDPEQGFKNLILFVLGSAVTAGVMAATATVTALFRTLVGAQKHPDDPKTRVPWNRPLVVIFAVFAVLLLFFRNGRTWMGILVLVSALLVLRFLLWEEKNRWADDLKAAIALQFALTAAFSLVHRYYFAWVYSRFSMTFHTVTVTSYYLLAVSALSAALLVSKLPALYRMKGRLFSEKLSLIWKEALFFGTTSSYMLMTVTRAGIGGLVLLVLLACLAGLWDRRRVLRPLRGLLTLALVFLITFPCVFTLQRIVPVTVRDPQHFEEVEPYPDEVNRHMRPDSRWFMSVEVLVRDIGDRILGGELGTRIFRHFDWDQTVLHYDTRLFAMNDAPAPVPSFVRSTSPLLAEAGQINTASTSDLENGDYSNGRIAIWKAYLSQLNLTGHESMNAVLPDGSLAIHAHNTALQLTYDCGIPTGIVGLAALILLFAFAIRTCRKRGGWYALFVLLALSGYLLTGLVEWIFQLCNPYTVILLLAVLPLFSENPCGKRQSIV